MILLVSLGANAQDTTRIEQYCEVTAVQRAFSKKFNFSVEYGENKDAWNKDQVEGLLNLHSTIDALNYIGKIGWKLVASTQYTTGMTTFQYIFKKEFLKKDIGY